MAMPQGSDEAKLLEQLAAKGLDPSRLRGCPLAALQEMYHFADLMGCTDAPTTRAGVNDQMSERREVEKLREGFQSFAEGGLPGGGKVPSIDTLVAGFMAERRHGRDPHLTAEEFLGQGRQ